MRVILILSLLLFAVPALAVTYEWVDGRGTVNFTEDLGNVPKKYRKHVKILGGEENSEPEVIEMDDGGQGKAKEAEGKTEAKDKAIAKEPKKVSKLYDGKEESVWKAEYKKISADIIAVEEQLDQLQIRLSDSSKMSRSEYLGVQHTIKNSEFRLTQLRKKLETFDSSAARAGVPATYRE